MSRQAKQHLVHTVGVSLFIAFFAVTLMFGRSISSSAQSSKDATDSRFAKNAASGGMAEVKLGKLAQEKANSEAVKSFGKRMMQDHTQAGEQLKQAARSENITLPEGLDAKDEATYDRLSKLSGAEFDRAYMQTMVKDHEDDVAEFKREANSGHNKVLKDFASQTLPTLEDHLKEAKEVAAGSSRKASI